MTQRPGVPNAAWMALRILDLKKPEWEVTHAEFARAFGVAYEDVWNPFHGSLLYDGPEGRLARWELLQKDIRDLQSTPLAPLALWSEQPVAVRRWTVARAIHGDTLLPRYLDKPTLMGEGFHPLRFARQIIKLVRAKSSLPWFTTVISWKAKGTLVAPPSSTVDWAEVTQGRLKDCSLLATVSSVLHAKRWTGPEAQAGNRILVRVGRVERHVAARIRWDDRTHDPVDAQGLPAPDGATETWPAMTEYAYRDHRRGNAAPDENQLSVIECLFPWIPLNDLTAAPVTTVTDASLQPAPPAPPEPTTGFDWTDVIDDAERCTRPAVAWTKSNLAHESQNVMSYHSYSVVGGILDGQGNLTDVVLRNPMAISDPNDPSLRAAFVRLQGSSWQAVCAKFGNGLVPIPLSSFWGLFEGLCYV